MCCNFQGGWLVMLKNREMITRPAIFKWRQTEPGLILCAVRWYLRYSLSLRDIEELLEERGLNVDHTTVWRWVQCYGPELEQRLRQHLKPTNKSWRVCRNDGRGSGGKEPSATGYKVYIGSTSGAETLQGTVSGWTPYSQSTPLSAGANPPGSNTSVCSIAFSDQLIPTGTAYTVNFLDRYGSKVPGFPQTWCTCGGAAGSINVSNGTPTGNCGTNGVFYPTPIQALPALQSQQSILVDQGAVTEM